jgi:hypothetical protein
MHGVSHRHALCAVQKKISELICLPRISIARSMGKRDMKTIRKFTDRGLKFIRPTARAGVWALLTIALMGLGAGSVMAQTVPTDERVRPDGEVSQKLALTPEQKNAIYNAVAARHDAQQPAQFGLPPLVGALVPPTVELNELPDEAAADNPWAAGPLKYAMAEDDIVVVDPIRMRVVDIIRKPGKL